MNGSTSPRPPKCPVCAARFRGSVICTRCGTDLTSLMRIAAKAWHFRQQSRDALLSGDLRTGLRLHAASQRLRRAETAE